MQAIEFEAVIRDRSIPLPDNAGFRAFVQR